MFGRKKKKEDIIINSKFKVGDQVRFRYRGDLVFGWIYTIKKGPSGNIIYDVQIGGQCPAIIYDIEEEALTLR